jgi:hypothetical protein
LPSGVSIQPNPSSNNSAKVAKSGCLRACNGTIARNHGEISPVKGETWRLIRLFRKILMGPDQGIVAPGHGASLQRQTVQVHAHNTSAFHTKDLTSQASGVKMKICFFALVITAVDSIFYTLHAWIIRPRLKQHPKVLPKL